MRARERGRQIDRERESKRERERERERERKRERKRETSMLKIEQSQTTNFEFRSSKQTCQIIEVI